MANKTPNYALVKPAYNEWADITVLNNNLDIIDTQIFAKASKTTQIIAGLGLTGGGDLTTDRTINIASANDGIIANADNIQLDTQNNLTSTSITKPLSANMGKFLQDTKLNLTGGTLTGTINGTTATFSGNLNINGDLNGGIFKTYDMSALSSGTTYTNTTGRAMFISISEISSAYAKSRYIELYVNNSRITRCDNSGDEIDDLAISVIVPPGATYKFIGGALSAGDSRIFYRCY